MLLMLVLQEIALNNETERKLFENEVGLLWKLRHPAIIKVEAIFYEGLRRGVIGRFRYIISRAERRRFACNSVWAFNLLPLSRAER